MRGLTSPGSRSSIDAVNFGPGETAQAHQREESASVEALGVALEMLTRFVGG